LFEENKSGQAGSKIVEKNRRGISKPNHHERSEIPLEWSYL